MGEEHDNQGNKKKGSLCGKDTVCDRTQLQLLEAQKTIANKDCLIKMLQNHIRKMGDSYKDNLKKTEEYRFKYCQAMEQVDKNKTIACSGPKKEKHDIQQAEIKNIKKELENWKIQLIRCENLLSERNNVNTSCDGSCEKVDKIMREHYDLLRNLISKIAVQRTINKSLSRTSSEMGGCPYNTCTETASMQKTTEVKMCPAPAIVEKLLALNKKIDDLNTKEERSLKELEDIKKTMCSVWEKTESCAGGIVQLNETFQCDKENTLTKLNSVEMLVRKNVGIQEELAEIRKKIEEVIGTVKEVKLTPQVSALPVVPETSAHPIVAETSKQPIASENVPSSPPPSSAETSNQKIRRESDAESLQKLKEHFKDLSREKQEKDEHIEWLNELISYYKKLDNDLNQSQPPMTPEDLTDQDDDIKGYFNKVHEDNTKLRATISNAMSCIQSKLSERDTKIKSKGVSQGSLAHSNKGKSVSEDTICCTDETCADLTGSKVKQPTEPPEELTQECASTTCKYECFEAGSLGEKSTKSEFMAQTSTFTQRSGNLEEPVKGGSVISGKAPSPTRMSSEKVKTMKKEPSSGEDVDIQDIYKSVLSSCKDSCRKKDKCALEKKALCEIEDDEYDSSSPCTCSECQCAKGSTYSLDKSDIADCNCPDEKNLLSNLESYKYYLQQQLEIISSIENEIDGLHDCAKPK